MVSLKWFSTASGGSVGSAAIIEQPAYMVLPLRPASPLQHTTTSETTSFAAITALSAAPPPPMTSTSHGCLTCIAASWKPWDGSTEGGSIQGIAGEQLLERGLSIDEVLFGKVLDVGLEGVRVCLETVRPEVLPHGPPQVLHMRIQPWDCIAQPLHGLAQIPIADLFGLHERAVEARGDPGVLVVDFLLDDDEVQHGKNPRPLKVFELDGFRVGKESANVGMVAPEFCGDGGNNEGIKLPLLEIGRAS